MDLRVFKASLTNAKPPSGIDLGLQAMWYEANGDWHTAHDLAQEKNDQIGAWVHAYLHRQEGDIPNARYWYSRAGRTMPDQSLEQEWDEIVSSLMGLGLKS